MSIKTLVTADDFGFSKSINRAMFEAYEQSRVSELSLMVDSYGTDEAVSYIRQNNIQNVGLHFSLYRLSKGGKILQGNDYDRILKEWTKEQLEGAFDEEIELFRKKVGFSPKHVIGHKQIALHTKLVEHVAHYCTANNCYARKEVIHKILQPAEIPRGLNISRTVDRIFAYHWGTPEEMYSEYKKDVEEAKRDSHLYSIEFMFHPGYAGEFEKNLTSFIKQRIDDIHFLLSPDFLKLMKEEELQLVSSGEI